MEAFVSKQLELLAEEHAAEIEESLADTQGVGVSVLKRKGLCIPKLTTTSVRTGLYGRTIATFSPRSSDSQLPFNIFTSGDIVQIGDTSNKQLGDGNGVVTSLSEKQLSVAFEGTDMRDELDCLNSQNASVTLLKVANEVTHRRLKSALTDLRKYSNGPSKHLVEILFGDAEPTTCNTPDLSYVNLNLNDCQQKAVEFAFKQRELAIVHGPPGTGKTTTVVEIVAQLVKFGQKVLACCPSNIAVDNLVEKLASVQIPSDSQAQKRKIKILRIGHPARIHKRELHNVSLDACVATSDAAAIVRDVQRDIDDVNAKLTRCRDKGSRQKLRSERKALYSELAQREKKALHEILSLADVVLATNVGAHSKGPLKHLKNDHFDVVVIDECGQALEASCWIPLLRARKCILAGDHLQLPPTIKSHKAAAKGLALTLLERLIDLHGDSVVCMLTEQYRMHRIVMQWSSDQLYGGRLSANSAVANHLLRDMPGVQDTEDTSLPMLMIDTAGCDMTEAKSDDSVSKANEGEAKIVYRHVVKLCEAGVDPKDIAVISPYNLQVDMLRQMLHSDYPKLEIKSVDGFQGREKEAVVLSLVRSNKQREVGFLADNRRLNVAVTRARRHVAVICDSETVSSHEFLRSLISYINEHGEVRTGFEYDGHTGGDDEQFACLASLRSMQTSRSNKGKEQNASKSARDNAKVKSKHTATLPFGTSEQPRNTIEDIKKRYCDILRQFAATLDAEKQFDSRAHQNTAPKATFVASVDQASLPADFLAKLEALQVSHSTSDNELRFSASLNSAERKAVHELCEEIGLRHTSVGQGSDRHVIVSSPNGTSASDQETSDTTVVPQEREAFTGETPTVKNDSDIVLATSPSGSATVVEVAITPTEAAGKRKSASENEPPADNLSQVSSNDQAVERETCAICGRSLPVENMTMHLMHCERVMRLKSRIQSAEPSNPTSSKNRKAAKKKSAPKSNRSQKSTPDIDDDFDALVDAAIASNRACFHGNCASSVATTGQICSFCKNIFCLKHSLPEVHGCGRGARQQARQQIVRDGILYPGSGTPDRKPPPEKRAALQNKLTSKVKDMENSRRNKNKRTT